MQQPCQEPSKTNLSGREKQKRRMRALLLRAAIQLIERGVTPTVPEVADAADVSRRTAYRYFPTQEQLLTEASLEKLKPQVERILDSALRMQDPVKSLDTLVAALQHLTIEHDVLLRTMVRLSLDRRLGGQTSEQPGLPVRGSRRVEWISAVLAPVRPRLKGLSYERLVSGLTLCIGPEALIVLRDTRGLSNEDATKICRWVARALLEAALG
jgi:AcrR family transcriptional regulator